MSTPIYWPEGQWCLLTIFGAQFCLGTAESGVNDADPVRIRLNSMSVQLQYLPLGGGGTTTMSRASDSGDRPWPMVAPL